MYPSQCLYTYVKRFTHGCGILSLSILHRWNQHILQIPEVRRLVLSADLHTTLLDLHLRVYVYLVPPHQHKLKAISTSRRLFIILYGKLQIYAYMV